MAGRTTLLGLLVLASCLSCRKDEGPCLTCPPPYAGSIELDSIDVGVTEAWLRVRFVDTVSARTFQLTRDGQIVLATQPTLSETTLVDTGLVPRGMFRYKAYRLSNGVPVDSSLEVQLTTMDTTSHDFTWQIDTLGDGNSSILYDVAIANDTSVWAVGEIYVRDSSGQFEPPYNVARWDGTEWTLIRLGFPQYNYDCTIAFYSSVLAVAVHAFGLNDVIFTDGAAVAKWNGTAFTNLPCIYSTAPGAQMVALLQTSNSQFYGVARQGLIVRYDGSSWRRIESGTTLNCYDIWGVGNQRTSEYEVYAVAANLGINFDKKILRILVGGVTEVSDRGIPYSIHGIWFKPERRYFVVGDGMYSKRSIESGDPWQPLHPGVTPYYTYAVRGNDLNDVFVCGSFGEMLHFNGVTWRSFRSETAIAQGAYNRIDVRGNLVVAVGYEYPRAIVAIGRR